MNTRLKTGFSLIDTLLGVGMFLIVTTALAQFTFTTLRAADNLDLQVRAQNAAREGLEIMENIRGTNAISFVTWESLPADHPRQALAKFLGFSDLRNKTELCVTLAPIPGKVPWDIRTVDCPTPGDMTPPRGSELQELGGTSQDLTRYLRIRRGKDSPTLRDFVAKLLYTSELRHQPDDIIEVDSVVGWDNHGSRQELVLKKVLTDWYQ